MADPKDHYDGGLGVAKYDLFYGNGVLDGDVEFFIDCARRFKGPILELGAGTGRITIPLANAGFDVCALDLSKAMLDLAAVKIAERPGIRDRVQLIEADMRGFDLDRKFSQAIIPARSFQHIMTVEDQRATLRTLHRHLEPGGHLVIDLFDPIYELLIDEHLAAPLTEDAHDPTTGGKVRRTVIQRRNDLLRQTIDETLRFEQYDAAGNLVATEEMTWRLRWIFRQEMIYLLELSGFEVVAEYSDFEMSPPSYGQEQIWVAQAR